MDWIVTQKLIHLWKILRGDNVIIVKGKDGGETGTIKHVIGSQNCVIVKGKNLVKKHIKQGQGHEGGIFTVEAPLHVSNVQVLDPVTGKPSKVGIKYQEDGSKVRVSRGIGASGSIIPCPEILKIRTTPRPAAKGEGVKRSSRKLVIHDTVCVIGVSQGKNTQAGFPVAGPKDTPMDMALGKTYDAKTGMGMPDP